MSTSETLLRLLASRPDLLSREIDLDRFMEILDRNDSDAVVAVDLGE